MSQEKFGFIRELTLPELWQLSYAIQERVRTLSMAPSQVWHIEIQQTGGYQPGLDQVVPPCPKWYLGDGTTGYTKGATVSFPAPSGEGPNSDTKSDTTMSDRVQASMLYDDPWEVRVHALLGGNALFIKERRSMLHVNTLCNLDV